MPISNYFSSLLLLAPKIHYSVIAYIWICLFLEISHNWNHTYLVFCDKLLSFKIIFPNFICTVVCIIPFYCWIMLLRGYTSFVYALSINRYLSSLHFLAGLNNTAINFHFDVFVWHIFLFLLPIWTCISISIAEEWNWLVVWKLYVSHFGN